MKAIHALLASAAISLLVASAYAQRPKPTPKREMAPPSTEQPKPQLGALLQKPIETKCETPHLDRYPKDELRPVTGKSPDHYIPPAVPTTKWAQPCKLGAQSPASVAERS